MHEYFLDHFSIYFSLVELCHYFILEHVSFAYATTFYQLVFQYVFIILLALSFLTFLITSILFIFFMLVFADYFELILFIFVFYLMYFILLTLLILFIYVI
jgi:hypothetical protein